MMTSSNGNIFPVTGPFLRIIDWSPVDFPHEGQRRGVAEIRCTMDLSFLTFTVCYLTYVLNGSSTRSSATFHLFTRILLCFSSVYHCALFYHVCM